jgi:hypothetical protein
MAFENNNVFIVKKEMDTRILLRLQLENFVAERFQFNLWFRNGSTAGV